MESGFYEEEVPRNPFRRMQASESVTSAIFAGSIPNNLQIFFIPFQVENIEKLRS